MISTGKYEKPNSDVVGRTYRGIGAPPSTRDDGRREEDRWVALVRAGLISLETQPTLAVPRESIRWRHHDDVELHVLLRIHAACTLRALIEEAPFPRSLVARALSRLARRRIIRIA